MPKTWDEFCEREAERLAAGPEESAAYAATVALTGFLDREGVTCPAATVVEALAALVAERATLRGEPDADAEIVVDLENVAAKWRGRLR
jgi:hypothetical protein